MIRTWKCLLGTIAVCALLAGQSRAQEIRANQEGVVHLRTDEPLNETQPADWLYGAQESVWVDDFQPPPGIGVDPVTVPQDNNVGYAVTSDIESILYRVYRTQRHFYGLPDSFTSAGAFIPLRVMNGGTSLLAIDPRMFVNDYGRGGINLGLTARRYFPSSDRILSSSLWIDYDNGHVGGGYGQVGLYGSIIGRYLTTSAFANIPFGEEQNVIGRSLSSTYVGNALALTQTSLLESPYAHYQVEVATPIPYFSRFGFDYGFGVYALASRADGVEDGWGVSNRIQAQVTEDLTVNALVTSDGVFGSNLSINLQFTLPNGLPSRMLRRKPVRAHLTDPDNRSPRVLTNIVRHRRNFAAIDPKDGQIITVAHIDPDSFGNGTGVNDPFGSVAQFEALPDNIQSNFRIIFVRPRNDGTDTNLNTGITLFDEQKLLGDGIDHVIDTTLGPVLLPGVTPGGPTPLLTNSGAPGMDVVTLADWNTVSGFTIDASAGSGDGMDMDAAIAINGRGLQAGEAADPGVNGFIIDRNTIQNGMYGLVVDSETTGESVGVITDNQFLGNALGAVDLNYRGSVVAGLTIEDNLIVASSAGVGFLPEMLPVIRQNMGFTNNVLAANDDGSTATAVPLGFMIDFFGLAANDVWVNNNGNITFTGPLFTFTPFDLLSTATPIIAPFFADVDTRNHGMEVTYGQDMVQGQAAFGVNWLDVDYFASNTAHGTQLNDFQLVLIDRSDIGAGDFDIEFNYDQILWETGDASGGSGGLGGSSARVGYANGTTTAFELPGSAVNGAFLDGGPMALVDNMLNSTLPGRYRFAVRNGVVTTTGTGVGTGISITASDNAVVGAPGMPATFRRNEIEGYDDGLVIRGPGMAAMNFDISDNFINGVGNNGITLITEDDETMTVTGRRNVVINSGANGLAMFSSGNSVMNVSFENSVFNENAERGVKGVSEDSSAMSFSFTSPLDPFATEDRNGNGILDPLEDLNGNGVIDPLRATVANNEGAGIEFTATDDSRMGEDANRNGVLDAGEDLNGNGVLDPGILIDDVLVEGNLDAGIWARATNGSGLASGASVDIHVTNSDIVNNADGPDADTIGPGIRLQTTETAYLQGLIMNNMITGNSGNGIRLFSRGNSEINLHDPAFVYPSPPNPLPVRGIFNNVITDNGITVESGIFLDRHDSSVLTADVMQNIVDDNVGRGLVVFTFGGNGGVPAGPPNATPLGTSPETRVFVRGNEFTNNGLNGVEYLANDSSVLYTELIGNLIDANGANGVDVTTNNGSFFGWSPVLAGDIGWPSIFDSNQITNNVDNGVLLTNNNLSTLVVDITSIEAAMNPMLYDRTVISGNGVDGIHAIHNGGAIVSDFALSSIRIGTAFAFPDPDVFEVEVVENGDDAIDVDINPGSSGVFNMNVSDTLLRGGRALGALADPGISITHDSSFTVATVVVGADISDAAGPNGLPRGPVRDAVGGAFDNTPYARSGSVITDFAGDGINVVYSNSDSTGSELNLRLFDSVIGQSLFGFNTGDGLDITVDNAGDPGGSTGFDAIVDNTQISGNGGHGITMRTVANTGGLFIDGVDALDGALLNLGPAMQTDSNNNGVGDTIFDGAINGMTTSDDFINSLPFVLDPAGNDNGWADLTSPDDFIADLQIINGSRVDFNGQDGVHLEVGTATRQRVSMQNSSFSGNGDFELNVQTFASFEPDDDDVDRAEGMIDTVGLDPTAKLDIFLGSLNFVRSTPAGFPQPGPTPVPAEFAAAIGGEGFNTSDSTRVLIDYASDTAVGFQNASTFKGAPRPANLFIRALVPEDTPLIDDIDLPLPNRFLNFGQPFDETLFFSGNLPASTFPGRYLDLNTP